MNSIIENIKAKKLSIVKYQLAIIISLFLCACSGEQLSVGNGGGTPDATDQTMLTISMIMPTRLQTYALTNIDETAVNTIDILVFDINGSAETFSYHMHVASEYINDISDMVHQKKITTWAYGSPVPQRFVVVANASAAVTAAVPVVGESKESLLSRIIFDMPSDAQWTGAFPMWSEFVATIDADKTIENVYLLRAVARVNVSFPNDYKYVFGGKNISLALGNVYLRNAKSCGYVCALAASAYSTTNKAVAAPVVPAIATSSINASYATTSNVLQNTIYIPETKAETTWQKDYSCLVLQILDTDADSVFGYYRVGITDVYGAQKNILRNHSYNIAVQSVWGSGFKTVEAAASSLPANITANVVSWNDIDVGGIVPIYEFSVSQASIKCGSEYSHSITVKTNYPSGWTASIVSGNVTSISPMSGASGSTTITITENIAAGSSAKIAFTAGNFTKYVQLYRE